jgi:nucleotide-binding universal stress UspA family protein
MFTNIVVGVDGGQGGRDAVALAKQLAQPDSKITLANCYGQTGLLRLAAGRMHADSSEMLTRTAALASIDARLVSLAYASVSRGLHQFATHVAADLLVLGSRHRGTFGRALLGEDSHDALDGAPCPVAIAPSGYDPPQHLARIGVGYEGSEQSEPAMQAAESLARLHDSRVSALSVVSLKSIPYGEPGAELARFGGRLDLLIVDSGSEGLLERLLNGSTSDYPVRQPRCPLLVMPRSAAVEAPAGQVFDAAH